MRLAAALVLMAGSAAAFAPVQQAGARQMAMASTLEYEAIIGSGSSISADDFNAKLAANRETMSAKDKTSKSLGKDVSIYTLPFDRALYTRRHISCNFQLDARLTQTSARSNDRKTGVERNLASELRRM